MELKHIVIAVISIAIAVVIGFTWMEINETILGENSFIVESIKDILTATVTRATALIQPAA